MFQTIASDLSNMLIKLIALFIFLQVSFAIGIIIAEEYIKYLLTQHLLNASQTQTYTILLLAQALSIQFVILYCYGLSVAAKCNQDVYTPHLASLFKLWIIFGFVSNCEGLFLAVILGQTSKNLPVLLELELNEGLEEYYFNPEWRLIWDNIQFHEKCCGVYDYKDWKEKYFNKLQYLEELSS